MPAYQQDPESQLAGWLKANGPAFAEAEARREAAATAPSSGQNAMSAPGTTDAAATASAVAAWLKSHRSAFEAAGVRPSPPPVPGLPGQRPTAATPSASQGAVRS